jgi:hypothetical protein
MRNTTYGEFDPATDRLTAELADVRAAIELVATGVATGVTLTGMHFGRQVTRRLARSAEGVGVHLDTSLWPDEEMADIRVETVHRA